ncbi:hypothetical protein QQ44_03890 [Mycolicibacterium setense]|uniref:Uncharacterized protein n=2 Tax=Mycolicibacterium setense TaxID=431269 RepID=A0ABR4Z0P8_9MYCO|nr:hypothetical protein QQ44_03890 [Mycolicibacterium setense]
MMKGLCVYPPAGFPYPGPQRNQPYQPGPAQAPYPPQPQSYPPAFPPPLPTPPWQHPGTGPQPQPPRANSSAKYLPIAIGGFLAALLAMGCFFLLMGDTGGYFSNGDTVTPTADAHIVFVKKQHLDGKPASSVRCSATTDSGEKLSLSVPSEVLSTSRGARPAKSYKSVAELPTDRGPLTVTCTKGGAIDSRLDLVLGKPDSSTGPTIFLVGYAILMIVLVTVAIIMRRRYFRRYPQPPGHGRQWQV